MPRPLAELAIGAAELVKCACSGNVARRTCRMTLATPPRRLAHFRAVVAAAAATRGDVRGECACGGAAAMTLARDQIVSECARARAAVVARARGVNSMLFLFWGQSFFLGGKIRSSDEWRRTRARIPSRAHAYRSALMPAAPSPRAPARATRRHASRRRARRRKPRLPLLASDSDIGPEHCFYGAFFCLTPFNMGSKCWNRSR